MDSTQPSSNNTGAQKKLDFLDAHITGINSDLRQVAQCAKNLNSKNKATEIEQIGDYLSHVIERLALITELYPEFDIDDDAKDSLMQLQKKVEAKDEPGEDEAKEDENDDPFLSGLKKSKKS